MNGVTDTRGTGPGHVGGVGSASGVAAAGLDPTDPESLFAFFQHQMQRAQGRLSSEMELQQARIDTIDRIHGLRATFTSFPLDSIQWNQAGWPQTLADLNEALAILGPESKEGKLLAALIQDATPTVVEMHTFDAQEAEEVKAAHHAATVTPQPDGQFRVSWQKPTVAVTKDRLKEIAEQLKARAETLTSESGLSMIRVQQFVEQSSQIVSHCSNVMKKMHEMDMAAIDNIR